ncbi:hypothetical protein EYF80_003605 [Liparis tanakae]|uniref:Uncharacterized protein n=1 Tax=Liparis tanakae TaxID=230148 RepID=A0A4Z2J918_9TELE|nr:hypothetical protein EYF80_003605 [Liparis tanakae]
MEVEKSVTMLHLACESSQGGGIEITAVEMLVNLPALFLSALSSPPPGSPPSLASLCPFAASEAASAGRQLQLEASPLGIALAVRLEPLGLPLPLAPDDASPPPPPLASPHPVFSLLVCIVVPPPPGEPVELRGESVGGVKGLLSPEGRL